MSAVGKCIAIGKNCIARVCSGWKCIAAWGRLGKCIAIGKNCIARVCSGWKNCIATWVNSGQKLYCNREVCWLGHCIAIHQGVLWLRRQGLWDKRITIQLLYCDIGAGLRKSVLQYNEDIVTQYTVSESLFGHCL